MIIHEIWYLTKYKTYMSIFFNKNSFIGIKYIW
jgi:hypothetical protein